MWSSLFFLATQQSSQENTPKTAKETYHFHGGSAKRPRKGTIFLVADKNSQENTHFSWRLTKIAKNIYFLAIHCYRQGNVIFLDG